MEMLFILQLIPLYLCVRQLNKLNLTWTFFVVEHVMNTCAVHDIDWFCVTVSRNQTGRQHHKTSYFGECLRLNGTLVTPNFWNVCMSGAYQLRVYT